jgi:hypothetical protein
LNTRREACHGARLASGGARWAVARLLRQFDEALKRRWPELRLPDEIRVKPAGKYFEIVGERHDGEAEAA